MKLEKNINPRIDYNDESEVFIVSDRNIKVHISVDDFSPKNLKVTLGHIFKTKNEAESSTIEKSYTMHVKEDVVFFDEMEKI